MKSRFKEEIKGWNERHFIFQDSHKRPRGLLADWSYNPDNKQSVQVLSELNAPRYSRVSSAGTPDDPVHRQLRLIPTLDQIENPHDVLTTVRTRTTTRKITYCIVLYCIVLYCILKPTLLFIVFKKIVRTSKRTPHFTITHINWLMLFKEIIAV
jgi:hypothetical protein